MVQLAIEIGIDNVRAVIKKGDEYIVVPLGSLRTPYFSPPICLRLGEHYIFGETAKMNAVSRPDETIFLSDYSQKGMIDKNVMTAFIKYVCQRVTDTYKDNVESITFVVPPYCNNSNIQTYLSECIRSAGHTPVSTVDSTLSFVRSNFNVALGDKICIIDMHDYPAYVAVVSRTTQSFSTLGSAELTEMSIIDCENIVEEKMSDYISVDIESYDNVQWAWMQSEIATSLSQYGLINLINGGNATIPLPFSSHICEISQSAFRDWMSPKIDKCWKEMQSLFQSIKTPVDRIGQVVLLGSLFRSDFIYEHFKKCIIGYGSNPKFTILSESNDDWNMCLSSIKTNFQSRGCALEL